MTTRELVVGLDNGGTTNNVTVLELATGRFLLDGLFELPSEVRLGPEPAIDAPWSRTSTPPEPVRDLARLVERVVTATA